MELQHENNESIQTFVSHTDSPPILPALNDSYHLLHGKKTLRNISRDIINLFL